MNHGARHLAQYYATAMIEDYATVEGTLININGKLA
jgi:hypothetical protein